MSDDYRQAQAVLDAAMKDLQADYDDDDAYRLFREAWRLFCEQVDIMKMENLL